LKPPRGTQWSARGGGGGGGGGARGRGEGGAHRRGIAFGGIRGSDPTFRLAYLATSAALNEKSADPDDDGR